MADYVNIKPKPMTIDEINEMAAQKEMLKTMTPKVMYKSGPAGAMTRPCKLFVKVDSEGLLVDNCTISDVVNFDCYESIMSSAHALVATFMHEAMENIEIVGLFYYKKRARSTRMNPVRIRNTTDGFRAVAEHPTGEVPIGVRWLLKKSSTFFLTGEGSLDVRKPHVSIEPLSPSSDEDKQKADEKRRQNEATTKLYWNISSKTGVHTSSEQDEKQTRAIKSKGFPAPKKDFLKKSEKEAQVESDTSTPPPAEERSSRSNYQASYLWPKDVKTEVVFSYGGLVERHKLNPALTYIVHSLTKGDYSCITKDTQAMLKLNNMAGSEEFSKGTMPSKSTKLPAPLTEVRPDTQVRKPIQYLKDAKAEIFKILSMVNLSRSRYKELLKWMKSLQLEDGKQGKFFLSERNVVGGPSVVYHTDADVARRASMKQRPTPRTGPTVLHPINPNIELTESHRSSPQPHPAMAPVIPTATVAPGGQILFLMPDGRNLVGNATGAPAQGQGLVSVNSKTVVPVIPLTTSTASQPPPSISPSPSENKPNTRSLRSRKRRYLEENEQQEQSPSPVPMKLYQLYGANNKELPLLKDFAGKETDTAIKQEPHSEFESENEAPAVEEYSENRDQRNQTSLGSSMYMDNSDHYSCSDDSVLKRDAPLSSDPLESDFEKVVVKSEPLDDYE